MTNERNPADAVREALLPCPFCGEPPQFGAWRGGLAAGHTDATAIECASGLDDCPVNPSVTGFTRQEAVAKWNRRPSLAALAGAAPVAWARTDTINDDSGCPIGLDEPRVVWGAEHPAPEDFGWHPLYNGPHAPAKAREDGPIAYTPAPRFHFEHGDGVLRHVADGGDK